MYKDTDGKNLEENVHHKNRAEFHQILDSRYLTLHELGLPFSLILLTQHNTQFE